MTRLRSFVRALVLAAGLTLMAVTPASAQSPVPSVTQNPAPFAPSPVDPPGVCAPWHRCIAGALMGGLALYVLATGGMYLYQRRGFDKVEHRQGNPGGVPVDK